ncbi:isoprenyl transferase [Taibaiella sp. KBW10]|uniref:isoprenyl transferase n=1 Tax=Taibaiella sp. KBW10 TaxID=2153357 RepID=UPI000F59313E|nr:isoprenyl transferase [Taibaiella sp. KBW10]RQO30440.1 isoprenyl transferase [Taibaiella sp. KBW10]
MDIKSAIQQAALPEHIAIIMDGNGRWAKEKGESRIVGHYEGVVSVRDIVEGCGEIGIKYLTLYAFSTENWSRPKAEVDALMELMVSTIRKEAEHLKKNNVRLKLIGNITDLPEICQKEMQEGMDITEGCTGLTLILALSYSARWEIVAAAKKIAKDVLNGTITEEEINDAYFGKCLTTAAFPDPELLIRTSGEHRISNFLLYQIAYSELFFTDVHWPAFRKKDLYEAILNYQQRERRFGMTSEQVKP